ncbi:hypothetical protein CCM_04430 [Cordyceps militaris CM01]|uniref:Apopolysialoglycoprotein n=1 Tax=Cordyceps militaris (strain CM01) TaxID=983644 RepID=G3JEU9_CORMM|nr:uncharacterized protein CCM_04430 [Cordyceps militaris CM01]EGX93058.1 hypothetical protein CCM_04430 [Cordyceps militaris CM01]
MAPGVASHRPVIIQAPTNKDAGLPVRQWRQEWVNVAPPIEQEPQQINDVWASELIHGMPKDSGLLTPHSQELLRAARSGRLYKRAVPTDEDETEAEPNIVEKPEKKEEEPAPKGFSVKLWKQVPRNVEASDITRLAKRRRNTVTIASKTPAERGHGPTVTRATVRRVDAAGNPYTEEVTLGDGQAVSGEIIATRVEVVQVPAAGAMSLGAQVPPNHRRRPPPPKRKTKAGPGRGKKKNRGGIAGGPPHTSVPNGSGVAMPSQPATAETTANDTNGAAKGEGGETADGDEEESEDGDEGDDDDDEHGDSDHPDTSIVDEVKDKDLTMTDAPPVPAEVKEMVADAAAADKLPANPMTLPPPLASLASDLSKTEGSPLKNVVLPSPTEGHAPVFPGEVARSLEAASGSTVAEPPSTIVGEEPAAAENRDLELAPTLSSTLLPPPPEQVGNIATPKADDASSRVSSNEHQSKDAEHVHGDKSFHQQDSIMTEDSIKPEDSASVRYPLTESGAPSEVGTGSVDDTKEPAAAAQTPGPVETEDQPEPVPVVPVIAEETTPEAKPEYGGEPPAAQLPKEEQDLPPKEQPASPPAAAVPEPAPQTSVEATPPAPPLSLPSLRPEPDSANEPAKPFTPSPPVAEPVAEVKIEEEPVPQPEESIVDVAPEEPRSAEPGAVAEPVVELTPPLAEPAPTASEPNKDDDTTAP